MAIEEDDCLLPPGAAEEVLHRYADLLRVGRLIVNGAVTSWSTGSSTEVQLRAFCGALVPRLRELLPELAGQQPAALRLASYWLLKAVSINYALIEVVLMVRRRVGVLCTIETRQEGGGPLVEYGVDVLPGPALRVSLTWKKGNNIVYRDPRTAQSKVKGSLASLATEFRLPPESGVVPAYNLDMRLKRSLASTVASKLACQAGDERGQSSLHLNEPLSSDNLLEAAAAAPCCRAAGAPPKDEAEETSSTLTLPSNEAAAPETCSLGSGGEDESPVGRLRARLLRARLDELLRPEGARLPKPKLYVTCTLAGKTQRSRLVPSRADPEWLEAWDFPVRMRDLRSEVRVDVFGVDAERGELELLASACVLVSLALGGAGAVPVCETLRGPAGLGAVDLELEMLPDIQERPRGHGSVERTPEAMRCPGAEDLSLRIQVRAAAPRATTCGIWCGRTCPPEECS